MIPQHRTLQIFGSPNRTQAPPSFVHSRCSMAKSESTFFPRAAYALANACMACMRAYMACMRACLDAHIVVFVVLVHACMHAWRACEHAWTRILLRLLCLSMPPCMRACVNACMRSASFGPSLHRLRPLMHACLRACMACTHTCLNAHSVALVCLIHACIDGVQARTPGRAYCGSCLSMPS